MKLTALPEKRPASATAASRLNPSHRPRSAPCAPCGARRGRGGRQRGSGGGHRRWCQAPSGRLRAAAAITIGFGSGLVSAALARAVLRVVFAPMPIASAGRRFGPDDDGDVLRVAPVDSIARRGLARLHFGVDRTSRLRQAGRARMLPSRPGGAFGQRRFADGDGARRVDGTFGHGEQHGIGVLPRPRRFALCFRGESGRQVGSGMPAATFFVAVLGSASAAPRRLGDADGMRQRFDGPTSALGRGAKTGSGTLRAGNAAMIVSGVSTALALRRDRRRDSGSGDALAGRGLALGDSGRRRFRRQLRGLRRRGGLDLAVLFLVGAAAEQRRKAGRRPLASPPELASASAVAPLFLRAW